MKRKWVLAATAGLPLGSATLPAGPAPESVAAAPSTFFAAPILAFDSLWEDTDVVHPPEPRVRVIISIPQQMAYVFVDEALVATSPVSTGKRGHATPVGTFRILQKKVRHRSNLYDASMPYMQRLAWDGVALHAGPLPGYAASHGCVRLPWDFAKRLYGMTDFTTEVTVTSRSPRNAEHALTMA